MFYKKKLIKISKTAASLFTIRKIVIQDNIIKLKNKRKIIA